MTREDVDKALEAMAAEAEAAGDPGKGPGAVRVTADEWIVLAQTIRTHVLREGYGVRYRGVRIRVDSLAPTGFQTQAEAEADGCKDFEPLGPREDGDPIR